MAQLHPCPECARHVRVDVTACPFCAASIDLSGVPLRPVPPRGLSRGALLAFSAAALASATPGCTTTQPEPLDAYYGGGGDAYGAPDAGPRFDVGTDAYGIGGDTYGAPDAPSFPDTGSTDDGGLDGGP